MVTIDEGRIVDAVVALLHNSKICFTPVLFPSSIYFVAYHYVFRSPVMLVRIVLTLSHHRECIYRSFFVSNKKKNRALLLYGKQSQSVECLSSAPPFPTFAVASSNERIWVKMTTMSRVCVLHCSFCSHNTDACSSHSLCGTLSSLSFCANVSWWPSQRIESTLLMYL